MKNKKNKNDKKIVLIIFLVILIPIILFIVGIILMIGTGFLATSSMETAKKDCTNEYLIETEKAIIKYKEDTGSYPNYLNEITDSQFPERTEFDICTDSLGYSTNGSTYTLSIK